jgi:gliding motility-associated-like protein
MPLLFVAAFFVGFVLFCSLAVLMFSDLKINIFSFCFLLGTLSLKAQTIVNAGSSQQICPYTSITLGGNPTATEPGDSTFTYQWLPANLVSNDTIANPTTSPGVTTIYTVIVTDQNKNSSKGTVSISVYNYTVNAGRDTTIKEGQTITLHAQAPGNTSVYWNTTSTAIYNPTTLNPDVFPEDTTKYVIAASFPNGCVLYDEITVNVIPGTDLVFYNSFSPNGDGANDFFYIGNVDQYPNNTLDVFNRYGQKVFTKTGYNNDWNASYLGTDLPSGVYFYIFDTNAAPGKFRGEVSIIR